MNETAIAVLKATLEPDDNSILKAILETDGNKANGIQVLIDKVTVEKLHPLLERLDELAKLRASNSAASTSGVNYYTNSTERKEISTKKDIEKVQNEISMLERVKQAMQQ